MPHTYDKLNALVAKANARKATKSRPHLQPHPEERYSPFPLSDMQQAYWIGRSSDLQGGGVAMQSYVEIECSNLDISRLSQALDALVARHEMLRAVVTPDGMQRVLPLPLHFPVTITDLSGLTPEEQNTRLDELAEHLNTTVSDLSQWPQSEIHFSRLASNTDGTEKGILHFRWDMWATDGRSFQILYEDLAALYLDPHVQLPPLPVTFRDYMMALKELENNPAYTASLSFWQEQLRKLPPAPSFPKPQENLCQEQKEPVRNVIKRYEGVLTTEETSVLNSKCAEKGFSITALLATVYSEVISFWSSSNTFTLSMPRFNRNLHWHECINHIMGEFATFTLVPVDLSFGGNIADKAAALQHTLWGNLEHAEISGVRLLRELAKIQGKLNVEAMPVVFTAMPARKADDNGVEKVLEAFGRIRRTHGSTPQTTLDCQYTIFSGALHIYWDAKSSAFPPGMTDDMFEEYMRILRVLATTPDAWRQPNLVSLPAQQMQRRADINNRPMDLPTGTVCNLFLNKVKNQPDSVAIISPDRTLTYRETLEEALWVRKNLLDILPTGYPQNGEIASIALVLERGWQSVVCALGAQLAGMPYLPLDCSNPSPRLVNMLHTGKAAIIITESKFINKIENSKIPTITTDNIFNSSRETHLLDSFSNLPNQSTPAYIMLTSGTTGAPKAVVVSHRNLLNTIIYTNNKFSMGPNSRVIGITSMHHDMSVYDIFGSLTSGAALVTLPQDKFMQPEVWIEYILQHNITFWNSVPAFLNELLQKSIEQNINLPIKFFITGGDWVEKSLFEKAHIVSPGSEFYSVGGPTETSIWNIMYHVDTLPTNWSVIPYGYPINNNSYYILDEKLRDLPDWVTGEMYCSGENVCIDILSDDKKQRFFVHPKTGERLYRTGDMGRYHSDGLIEILGRSDFQINIGGYRLDPTEIETVLVESPYIERAIVIPVGVEGTNSGKALGTFIIPAYKDNIKINETILHEWLKERLPLQMIPKLWRFVTEFPLTANGKVDRRALIETAASEWTSNPTHGEAAEIRAPQTPLECLLAELWSEVLNVDIPGVQANFFRLGGDSLKAVQILTRLKEKLPVTLPLATFFTTPTIEGLAKNLITLISARMRHTPGDATR